jgi:hypothetical protein
LTDDRRVLDFFQVAIVSPLVNEDQPILVPLANEALIGWAILVGELPHFPSFHFPVQIFEPAVIEDQLWIVHLPRQHEYISYSCLHSANSLRHHSLIN